MTTDEEASNKSTSDSSKPGSSDKSTVSVAPDIMESSTSSTNPATITGHSGTSDTSESQESNKRTKTDLDEEPVVTVKGDASEVTATVEDVHMSAAESLTDLTKPEEADPDPQNMIEFTVVYMKENRKISMKSTETIDTLKTHLESIFGVVAATAKLLYKVKPTSDMVTLEQWGLKNGTKVILMGTKSTELDKVPVNISTEPEAEAAIPLVKEPLSKQKPHCKHIDKGKPDDAMAAMKSVQAPLPIEPLHGMVTRYGGKARLTFKLELDQLWIGTKERTTKINLQTIQGVVSEPIDGHEEYHMLAIQTGPTEQSRMWFYWVPAQYVQAIKDAIFK